MWNYFSRQTLLTHYMLPLGDSWAIWAGMFWAMGSIGKRRCTEEMVDLRVENTQGHRAACWVYNIPRATFLSAQRHLCTDNTTCRSILAVRQKQGASSCTETSGSQHKFKFYAFFM